MTKSLQLQLYCNVHLRLSKNSRRIVMQLVRFKGENLLVPILTNQVLKSALVSITTLVILPIYLLLLVSGYALATSH